MSNTILSIRDLVADYVVREGIIRAVDHVWLDLSEGEIMGLVGESGCGKTSLVQAAVNLMPPNGYIRGGQVLFRGIDILKLSSEESRKLRWEKIAIVFQAAQSSMNPVLKVQDHMVDTFMAHRKGSKEEIIKKACRLLELVQLDPAQVMSAYPHELSGGMRQRVIIAMSLLLDPEILILDEPTSALDVVTQSVVLDAVKRVHEEMRISMLYVTHDLPTLAEIADRIAVMYAGKILEIADVNSIFFEPKHPYTVGLINSIPSIVGDLSKLKPIPGNPPSLLHKPSGCVFHPRCEYRTDLCRKVEPKLKEIGRRCFVACHRY